jgi:hypothetical protein
VRHLVMVPVLPAVHQVVRLARPVPVVVTHSAAATLPSQGHTSRYVQIIPLRTE